jgi:acetylornithine deacetylase/succinyl-diaminopimelate desuccinylase-like protein
MTLDRSALQDFARRQRGAFEDLLGRFVEVPSVSADPAHKPDLERVAELGAETIRRFGGKADLFRVDGGSPVVLGSFDAAPGAPTVTVYNHLDVQPASRETEPWRTEPFRFTRQGDTYFGRGTTDDKGPALTALYGAQAARDAGVPVNIRFLWETEEEVGSPHFEATLRSIGAAARTDVVVVSDTVWVSRGRPSLSAGLRGLQRFLFRLETAETDQHSGTTGGVARNPVAELAQLSAEIFDARTGRVKIPGFYDDVAPLSRKEREDFRRSGFSVKGFVKDHGFKSIRTRDAMEVMERLWARPTFEVHGLVGGYSGPGVKTIVPPRAELKATVRLVPDMKGEKVGRLVKAFVKKRSPDVEVEVGSSAPAYKGTITGPYVEAAQRAVKFAFGKQPVFVREGGTIGAVLSMEQILKVPIVFMGLSLPDHGYHAPNENFDWGQAGGGIVAFAKLLEEVAAVPSPRRGDPRTLIAGHRSGVSTAERGGAAQRTRL